MQSDRFLKAILAAALGVASMAIGAPETVPAKETPAFREFNERVRRYLKLPKSAPALRNTKEGEEIVQRRHALAQKIQEERSHAKPGDIFSHKVAEEFRRVIQGAFDGPKGPNVRKTIRQGEPVAGWRPIVNAEYPDKLPLTTVPPTLLLLLPMLPPEVSYRIIGHDFVLEDTEARVILDLIPGIIP